MRWIVATLMVFTLLNAGSRAQVLAQEVIKEPYKSVAAVGFSIDRDGRPRFSQALAAFDAVESDKEKKLQSYMTLRADYTFRTFKKGAERSRPFDAEVVRALSQSCFGPFFVSEGDAWAKISWVCDTTSDTAIAEYHDFQETSEIAAMIFFKGDKISSLMAGEQLIIPGRKVVRLDAYQLMKESDFMKGFE